MRSASASEKPIGFSTSTGLPSYNARRIGADESIHGLEDIRRHHERKAARGVSLKTIKLGGMRGVMAAGALCEQLGMAVNVSCKTGESSIACAAGVHIAAALPQIEWGLTLSNEGLGARVVDARQPADHAAEPVLDHLLLGAEEAFLVAAAVTHAQVALGLIQCRENPVGIRE